MASNTFCSVSTHLLFVLALVILVRDWRRVAITVTAFTLAHSITLAAATLGFVNVPGPPVEASIALSIVLVTVEILNARNGKPNLTARLPWLVAFSFGLLHGFGFASALAEVGLPQHAIPVALLFFNVGVEIGQPLFVAGVLSLIWLSRQAASRLTEASAVNQASDRLDVTVAYGIGIIAAYWLVERTATFFYMMVRLARVHLRANGSVCISRCNSKKSWRTRHDSNVWPSPSEGSDQSAPKC